MENKRKVITIIVLVIILLGIISYVLWIFILNKGSVVFKGSPPYEIALDSGETFLCIQSECSYELEEKDYEYTINKDGYYSKRGFIPLQRFETKLIDVDLAFIPEVLKESNWITFTFPAGYSKFLDRFKDISLFKEITEVTVLRKLPKKINDIKFSFSGEQAVIYEDNKVSLYDTENFSLTELTEISDAKEVVWSNDESQLYTISFDEDAKKDALKKVSLREDKETESLIFFVRDIEDYDLVVSQDDSKIALVDKTFQPEILYIIDLNERKRENVFEGTGIRIGKWSDDSNTFVFSGRENVRDQEKLWQWNNRGISEFSFEANISNVTFNNNEMFFISDSPFNIVGFEEPFEIQFFEREEATLTIGELQEEMKLQLFKWNIEQNKFFLLKDLTGAIDKEPDKIELSENGNILRILTEDILIDITISE